MRFSTEIIRPKIETLSFHDEGLWEKVLPSFIVKLNLHLDLVNKTRLLYWFSLTLDNWKFFLFIQGKTYRGIALNTTEHITEKDTLAGG